MMAAQAPSLRDHLLDQVGTILSGERWLIAVHLIDLIDESGYLTADLRDCNPTLPAMTQPDALRVLCLSAVQQAGLQARVAAHQGMQGRGGKVYRPG